MGTSRRRGLRRPSQPSLPRAPGAASGGRHKTSKLRFGFKRNEENFSIGDYYLARFGREAAACTFALNQFA
jgi:hypothetical protein